MTCVTNDSAHTGLLRALYDNVMGFCNSGGANAAFLDDSRRLLVMSSGGLHDSGVNARLFDDVACVYDSLLDDRLLTDDDGFALLLFNGDLSGGGVDVDWVRGLDNDLRLGCSDVDGTRRVNDDPWLGGSDLNLAGGHRDSDGRVGLNRNPGGRWLDENSLNLVLLNMGSILMDGDLRSGGVNVDVILTANFNPGHRGLHVERLVLHVVDLRLDVLNVNLRSGGLHIDDGGFDVVHCYSDVFLRFSEFISSSVSANCPFFNGTAF
jgi:hypothetical protein